MLTTRLVGSLLGCMFINLNMTTCQSPGEAEKPSSSAAATKPKSVEITGVETASFTPREKAQWSAHVTELLAPCDSVPLTIYECVEQKKDCAACSPAADYLAHQVRLGLTKAQVESAYRSRFAPETVKEIDLTGSPVKGAKTAPITVVEWADFECPACRAAYPVVDEVVKADSDVQFVFKNFPLSIHPTAENAARAAAAAQIQGKFWEMHHELFSVAPPLDDARLKEIAKKIGLDVAQFEKDLKSEEVADAVARDRKQGEAVGLRGTPTIFINGRLFEFQADLKTELREWFALEKKIAGKTKASSPAQPEPATPTKPGVEPRSTPAPQSP
ncbi:MAG: thioredoxin domain-containing protein [Polyangiaceae bacterium]|nr:thioredoxin domain-containing protein [Polyangiaceae bacterium]